LGAIYDEIAADSPSRANAMVDRLTLRAERIPSAPRVGRKVPEFNRDELREVFVRPYRLIYRIDPDSIWVLSILHFRQLLPEGLNRQP